MNSRVSTNKGIWFKVPINILGRKPGAELFDGSYEGRLDSVVFFESLDRLANEIEVHALFILWIQQ